MRFDCAGAPFSRVRASARVELSGHFWAPKVSCWGLFGSRLCDFGLLLGAGRVTVRDPTGKWTRSVKLSGPECGSDR